MLLVATSLSLFACRAGDSSTASAVSKTSARTLALTGWDPVGGEVDLCPTIKLAMPERGPRNQEYVCMISSRAWAALTKDSAMLDLALRDASGKPPTGEVSFWRDENADEPPKPTLVYWVVKFPSAQDDIGISVAVDSLTGKTVIHRDSEWAVKK